MKKKEYERPTMQVVQLKQRSQILAGSDVSATMDGTFTEVDLAPGLGSEDVIF